MASFGSGDSRIAEPRRGKVFIDSGHRIDPSYSSEVHKRRTSPDVASARGTHNPRPLGGSVWWLGSWMQDDSYRKGTAHPRRDTASTAPLPTSTSTSANDRGLRSEQRRECGSLPYLHRLGIRRRGLRGAQRRNLDFKCGGKCYDRARQVLGFSWSDECQVKSHFS